MAQLTDGERLVALETKMDTVLDNQKTSNDKFDSLILKLETLLPTYATIEYVEKLKVENQKEVEKLKRKNTTVVWLAGTLSASFGVLLTFLITFFLQNIGGQ